jgi:hypothetical protein
MTGKVDCKRSFPLTRGKRVKQTEFGRALAEVFLDPKFELYNATIRYGVF